MKDAQECVDALRQGDYFHAIQLMQDVTDKYEAILNKDIVEGQEKLPLGMDDLLQLAIYELCKTDINKNDIKSLNFLYNYIYNNRDLYAGPRGFLMTSLITSSQVALSVKNEDPAQEIIEAIHIENKADLINFGNKFSDFSELTAHAATGNDLAIMKLFDEMDEKALLVEIMAMDNTTFNFFQKGVEGITQEAGMEEFECPLVEARQQRQEMITALENYENYLKTRITKENNPQTLEKLHKKYQELQNPDVKNMDFSDKNKLEEVRQFAVNCKMTQPDKEERTLLQRISQAFATGIKYLLSLVSSESDKAEASEENSITSKL